MRKSIARRTFLRSTVAAGAAALAVKPLPALAGKREFMMNILKKGGPHDRVPAAFFIHFDEKSRLGEPAVARHLEYFRATGMDFVKIQYEHEFPRLAAIKRPEDWKSMPLYKLNFYEPELQVVRGLVSNNLYSWRMRAFNASGWGPYSPVRQFRPVFTGVDPDDGVPAEYSLSQNYPNPFNPSTRVSFGLPRESRVRLEIFNLLGERLMTAVDGIRAAGYHQVTLDASTLPAGMYLYRLTAGEQVMTRKMLLVK